jgi:hypothetical protein
VDRSGRVTDRGLTRNDALRMVKRRAKAAGLSSIDRRAVNELVYSLS